MTTGLAELRARVGGAVLRDEPLARHTTYRIGGPAAAFVVPRTEDDVVAALAFVRETGARWLPLGLGSNLLVGDAGFPGVVIQLGKGMDGVTPVTPDRWKIGAGLPTPLLARRTAQAGLAGVHRLVGVPGTVGGGVAMNAGAHGQDFASVVRSVRVVAPDGSIRELAGGDVAWQYRDSGLRDVVVVEAVLGFVPASRGDLEEEIRRHLAWRKAGTPFDQPCCGSVFRNPDLPPGAERRTAGQLIDAAGLKGLTMGRAQVSPMHANYIVNLGGATAADVRRVIDAVRERVTREFGVQLELEVKIIG